MRLKDVGSITALRALLAREGETFAETLASPESSAADRTIADEHLALIDLLDGRLQRKQTIDLATPRSAESAQWDHGSQTVGGYLHCLLRDEYDIVASDGWNRLAALSPVVIEVRPFSRPSPLPASVG